MVMSVDVIDVALAKKFTEETAEGMGAVKGKDGASVVGANVNSNHELELHLSDGKEINAGNIGYDVLDSVKDVQENAEMGKLVDATVIKEVFQSVSDGKEKIASAITDKGVETDADATFDTMAQNIGKIEGGKAGETYGGAYTVTPRVFEQELVTKGMMMANNVTVLSIPYSEVSNKDGGNTVTIG